MSWVVPLINIVSESRRDELVDTSIEDMMEGIYWKNGATREDNGKPAYTATQFMDKYWDDLLFTAKAYEHCNIWVRFQELREKANEEQRKQLEDALRALDLNINVSWPLQHYKTAVRYLSRKPTDIPATGGPIGRNTFHRGFNAEYSFQIFGQSRKKLNGEKLGP